MEARARPRKWNAVQQLLHWTMAVLVIGQLGFGLWLSATPHESNLRGPLFEYHASLGVTLLILVCIRLAWRLTHSSPALPASLPDFQKRLARLNHVSLYILLFLQPALGIVMNSVYGESTPFWGVSIPQLVPEARSLGPTILSLHIIAGLAIILLAAIHIAAALRHEFLLKDNVLRRMSPLKLRDGE